MTTYTMRLYDAAPQHKKKMKMSAIEKTLDFNLGPRDATFNKRGSWVAGDKIELIGVRPDQVLVGVTAKVIKPTTTEIASGHRISVLDPNGNALAYFSTGREATAEKIVDPYDVFFAPTQYSSSDTIDIVISAAFTTGVVKITAYLLEEDRS